MYVEGYSRSGVFDLNAIQLDLERERVGEFPETSRLVQTQQLPSLLKFTLGYLLYFVLSAWSTVSNGNTRRWSPIRRLKNHL